MLESLKTVLDDNLIHTKIYLLDLLFFILINFLNYLGILFYFLRTVFQLLLINTILLFVYFSNQKNRKKRLNLFINRSVGIKKNKTFDELIKIEFFSTSFLIALMIYGFFKMLQTFNSNFFSLKHSALKLFLNKKRNYFDSFR